jgi:hypothetical protein
MSSHEDRRAGMAIKQLAFDVKEQMVSLSGACFWYWNSFYSFLRSAGVPDSIYRKYPKDVYNKYTAMRAIISDLEANGRSETLQSLVSAFYRLRGPVDKDNLDAAKAKDLLNEFRMLVGDDPIEAEIKRKQQEQAREKYRESLDTAASAAGKHEALNKEFLALAGGQDRTPQERGYALERLFFDLLHLNEVQHRRPYRTPTGEQIDGAFNFGKFDYLVEVKWISGPTEPSHLSIFDGKIRGKAQSTRGLFLAAEGFQPTAVSKFSGDSPRILLMTGEDLALVLGGLIDCVDLLSAKVDAMVRHGRIDLPARELL